MLDSVTPWFPSISSTDELLPALEVLRVKRHVTKIRSKADRVQINKTGQSLEISLENHQGEATACDWRSSLNEQIICFSHPILLKML